MDLSRWGRRRSVWHRLALAAVLGATVLGTSRDSLASDAGKHPAPVSPPHSAAGIDQGWWQAVTDHLERQEYRASRTDRGLQAPNRAQNLRTLFGPRAIEVEPRVTGDAEPGWRFGWETIALGRPGQMAAAMAPTLDHEGTRVSYARPGWSEWYENSTAGIEQGFTLDLRPPGEGPLHVVGVLGGELDGQLREGALDLLDAHGALVLRYGKLAVLDANQTAIPSSLILEGQTLTIEVDDRGAVYPIIIDPLMTSPAWTAESNQLSADFGVSVATAGDVNGDGYSDVVVGAYLYDNGQADEGRAYVYLGSHGGLAVSPAWTAEGNQAMAWFGISVATAGDVNNDNFADLVIGAGLYDNGQADEGRVFVYHGSAAGLGATPSWMAEGNQVSAQLGFSATMAGDVNGDGFSDLIVGAPNADNGEIHEGRAFVYHGSPSGLGATPAWTAESNQGSALFGVRVATAGDVNGDRYADVLVGADLYDSGQPDEGRAYAYHGSPSGLASVPAWIVEGDQPQANLGRSLSTAGDVNGDGFSDVIIASPSFDDPLLQEGLVLVYHGSPTGLANEANWTGEGDQAVCVFGSSVSTAGDVNGDGFSDVIIGAPGFDNGEDGEGRAFVYFGSTEGILSGGWTSEANLSSASFGSSVATAGDVNGDGYSDVIIGSPHYRNGEFDEGRAFVYHGQPGGLAAAPASFVVGGQAGAGWGFSVATAGDVNGDGYSDYLVVADRYDNGQPDEGVAWGYYGSAAGAPVTPAWSAETNQLAAELSSCGSAGDVNGDGYSDVFLGSYRYDNGQNDEGRVFVYHGSPGGLSFTPAWTAESNQASAWFGWSAGGAGDVNGDGYGDLIVGSDGWDSGQSSEGRAWLYLGGAAGLGLSPAWTVEGNQDGAFLGYSVATAGDVNEDGYSDVLVGLPTYDNGQENEGAVWVFHGSAGGLSGTPSRVLEPNQPETSFGSDVATAGDVNADRFADVIIGADHYDGGQTDEGRAYVYHGGPSGLGAAPAWTTEPDQASAWLGKTVATAGDVNSDGYSDVLVGAPLYDNGQVDEGRVWAYYGSPTGLGAPVWVIEGGQPGALLGISAASAGDVNGDGFSDAIVGAFGFDWTLTDEGAVWVFLGGDVNGAAQGFTDGTPGEPSGMTAMINRVPKQLRTDGAAPIHVLGVSDSPTGFRLQTLARGVGGRGQVRLQWEVKPASTPFDGTGLGTGPAIDTGIPGEGGSVVTLSELVSGLVPNTLYHWRVRVLSSSPFFPRSPWFWLPDNAASEPDFRTRPGAASVMSGVSPTMTRSLLGSSAPNPFSSETRFQYTLPATGHVDLAVYDVQGRLVVQLVDEQQRPGKYDARWDGRNAHGDKLSSGVYFLMLDFAGKIEAQKILMRH